MNMLRTEFVGLSFLKLTDYQLTQVNNLNCKCQSRHATKLLFPDSLNPRITTKHLVPGTFFIEYLDLYL